MLIVNNEKKNLLNTLQSCGIMLETQIQVPTAVAISETYDLLATYNRIRYNVLLSKTFVHTGAHNIIPTIPPAAIIVIQITKTI